MKWNHNFTPPEVVPPNLLGQPLQNQVVTYQRTALYDAIIFKSGKFYFDW